MILESPPMKKFLFLLILPLLGAGCMSKPQPPIVNPLVETPDTKVYCQGEGILGSKQIAMEKNEFCIHSNSDEIYFREEKGIKPNTSFDYSFEVVDSSGNVITDFKEIYGKKMQLAIVRADLQEFLHLTPEFNATTKEFMIRNVVIPTDGRYRVIAYFQPTSEKTTVSTYETIAVGDSSKFQFLPPEFPETEKTIGNSTFKMTTNPSPLKAKEDATITVSLTQNGKPVNIDIAKYLPQIGPLFVVKEDELTFIPVPLSAVSASGTNGIAFKINFPMSGNYKVFLDYPLLGARELITNVIEVK